MRLIRLLKKDLAREACTWLDKGIVDEPQARAICAEYGVDFDRIGDDSGGYRLLVNLAWLFIGLAVITVLGANWEQIPRTVRLGGLMLATAGCHLVAIRLFISGREAASSGVFLLANILFGASIVLIAQMYHLGEHMPDGIFWWALGSLPVGLLTRNPMLTLFSCVLALIWFWVEYGMGYFPMLFPIFVVAGGWMLYVGRSSFLLLLTVVVSFAVWLESLVVRGGSQGFSIEIEYFVVVAALAVFFYAVACWLMTRNSVKSMEYGMVLSIWALRLILLMLFILSFSEPWRELLRAKWHYLNSMVVVVGLLMVATLVLGWYANRTRLFAPMVLLMVLALPGVIYTAESQHVPALQILTNILLVVAGTLLIIRGTHTDTSHYFFMGVVTILLTALLRYIDLIGDYIGGAILFVVMAAVMLFAACFWHNRNAAVSAQQVPS